MKLQKQKSRLWLRFKTLALASAISLTTLPATSHAGLKEAMNEMFVSTSTSTQAINTQRLKGMYGGSMSFRPIGRGIDITQFAPPRIDAGCGGIDIFFGSFSFINGAQFEQLIRSIAANAVGFAIKAAINGMCSPCGAILQDLEEAIRQLNALAKNTCAIANAMFDKDAAKNLKESAAGVGKLLGNVMQVTSDWVAGENKSQTEKPSVTATGGAATTADNNALTGNIVYRAATESLGKGGNTLRAFLSNKEVIEIIFGLYGTVIINPETKPGATCPAGTPAQSCDQDPEFFGPSIYSWDQLFKPREFGPAEGVSVYSCTNAKCTTMAPSKLPLSSWGGVQDAINMALYGVVDPKDPLSYSSDSIVGSFVHKNTNGQLSAQARRLVEVVPFPILIAMMEVQYIPGGPETLGMQIAAFLPDYLAYQMGVEFMTIGNNIFTGQTKVQMPSSFKSALADKSATLKRPDGGKLAEMMKKTSDSIKTIQELSGSQMRAGGGGKK